MIILTLRTDKPEAEIGIYNDHERVAYEIWQAHRALAETIHLKLSKLIESQNLQLTSMQGIVVFKGPGSFTGLRIGVTVANALADSLCIPIVGAEADDWIADGVERLRKGVNEIVVIPEYGALPNVSTPKK